MRILVTGSRQIIEQGPIYAALDRAYDKWLFDRGDDGSFVVTHGAAPGADTFANQWCWDRRSNVIPPTNDPHPADWKRHGRAWAGRIRNVEMIQLQPDLVLAFLQTGAENVGTRHCVTEAKRWLEHKGVPIVEEWI